MSFQDSNRRAFGNWPYLPGATGSCPYCRRGVQFTSTERQNPYGPGAICSAELVGLPAPFTHQVIATAVCPLCHEMTISLLGGGGNQGVAPRLIFPRAAARPPAPDAVPAAVAPDYNEAALILGDSPRAAGMLARRCLQAVLRTALGAKPGELADEIEEATERLPSYIAQPLDGLRKAGNLAAHPMWDRDTGNLIDVAPEEVEWTLDILERLFAHLYVEPKIMEERMSAIERKWQTRSRKPPEGGSVGPQGES